MEEEVLLEERGRGKEVSRGLRAALQELSSEGAQLGLVEGAAELLESEGRVCDEQRVQQRTGNNNTSSVTAQQLHQWLALLLWLLRRAARSRLKLPQLQKQLEAPPLKMCSAAASAAANAAVKHRAKMSSNNNNNSVITTTTTSTSAAVQSLASDGLDWRVEVTISTGSLQRVLRPQLLLALTLTDGTVVTCEASREAFQQLRYRVAAALKATEEVMANPILKIE